MVHRRPRREWKVDLLQQLQVEENEKYILDIIDVVVVVISAEDCIGSLGHIL